MIHTVLNNNIIVEAGVLQPGDRKTYNLNIDIFCLPSYLLLPGYHLLSRKYNSTCSKNLHHITLVPCRIKANLLIMYTLNLMYM